LAGSGLGIAWRGMQTAALEAVGVEEAGAASGVFLTSRYFGSIVGASVLAGLVGAGRNDAGAVDMVFLMVIVAAGLSTVAGLGLHDQPPDHPAARELGDRLVAQPAVQNTTAKGENRSWPSTSSSPPGT
jgi:hypothetical protein